MMICVNCKSPLRPGAKFCGKCGEKVVVERRCSNCNNLLEADEIFCTECGTRYDDNIYTEKQVQGFIDEPGQSSAVKLASCCVNTIKGKMAIIDDTLYFIGSDKEYFHINETDNFIGSVSLDDKRGKAKVILDKSNFFQTIQSEKTRLEVDRLHAWNGKLYFSAIAQSIGGDKGIFSDGDHLYGIFSFCPKSNKLELVKIASDKFYESIRVFFCDNMAYYLNFMDKETRMHWIETFEAKFGGQNCGYSLGEKFGQVLVTYDLATSQETRSFMPMLAEKDWEDSENGSGEIVEQWHNPIFYNGYIYTSIRSLGMRGYSLRFPVHNPEKYEFLPSKTIVKNDFVSGLHLFAASGDVIILQRSNREMIAISQSTLCPIDGFEVEYNFIDFLPDMWQVYGENYLVCPETNNNCAYVIDIKNTRHHERSGGKDLYKDVYDNIYYNNNIYAFGRGYERNGKYHDKLVLYLIPWDKWLLRCIKDFARPLF